MKRCLSAATVGLALLLAGSGAHADVFAPSLLTLREDGAGVVEVTWRQPTRGNRVSTAAPSLPARCSDRDDRREVTDGRALTQRWTTDCAPDGLVGASVGVTRLAPGSDVVVRVERAGESPLTAVLGPGRQTLEVPAPSAAPSLLATYTGLGFTHILGGLDHLLFVFGLLLLIDGRRRLIAAVTAFTLGHSVTLACASLGLVPHSAVGVEALIALSVVLLASEAARGSRDTLSARHPELIAGTFGLLHGLGFAGALAEIGLPSQGLWTALAAFNIGVELGQLAFVSSLLVLAAVAAKAVRAGDATVWRRALAYPVGIVATAWLIERIAPWALHGFGGAL